MYLSKKCQDVAAEWAGNRGISMAQGERDLAKCFEIIARVHKVKVQRVADMFEDMGADEFMTVLDEVNHI